MPVMTFVNKMDRPGLEPIELMDQVGKTLKIRTVALNWPIGMGHEFRGVYDRRTRNVHLYERQAQGTDVVPEIVLPIDHPEVADRLEARELDQLREEVDLLDAAGDPWELEHYLSADVTPFFFGSAMTNFGVQPLLSAVSELAPTPRPRPTVEGDREPSDPRFSGFIFKIQANMNPKHRDRIAFLRVVSGTFERGMDVSSARSDKEIRLSKPHTFMASERSIVEEAAPGDIVGLFDTGELRIGDTLYVGQKVEFQGIPRFAPEHFARVKLKDPTRRKHLQEGLAQLSQEGAIQLFFREGLGKADPYLGAVGQLQFEVLKYRLLQEYSTHCELELTQFTAARWVVGKPSGLAWLEARPDFVIVRDRDDRPVVLATSAWSLSYAAAEAPGLELLDVSPL
jgi:peptide chain release factor 3